MSDWNCATSALMERHNRLKGTLSDAAPIHWQYGAIARLPKGRAHRCCCTADIPPSAWVTQACMNAASI